MLNKMKNRKGFTLIEMMAVIAIVAVLVAIVVPTVGKAQNKAKGAADAANLRSLSASVATRFVSTTEAEELVAGLQNPGSQLFDGSHVLFYRDGNEINSYFSQSIINAGQLRGNGYNGFVAETGDLDKAQYDPAKGELLCVLTSNGESIASNVYNELVDAITNAYTNAYDSIYDEKYQGLYDGYMQDLVDAELALAEPLANAEWLDTFADAYGSIYATTAANKGKEVGIKFTLFGREVDMACTYKTAQRYGVGDLWMQMAAAEGELEARTECSNGTVSDSLYVVEKGGDISSATSSANTAKENYIKNNVNEEALKNNETNKGLADAFASGQVGMEAAGQAGQQVEDAYNNAGNIIGEDALQDQVEAETDSAIRDVINSILGNN